MMNMRGGRLTCEMRKATSAAVAYSVRFRDCAPAMASARIMCSPGENGVRDEELIMRFWTAIGLILVLSATGLTYEIAAGRVLAPFFGTSLLTWTAVNATVLAGFSLGNAVGGFIAEREQNVALRNVRTALIATAVLAALSPTVLGLIYAWGARGTGGMLLAVFLAFFPASVLISAPSPLLAKLAVEARPGREGSSLGLVLAAGSLGAIVGAVLAGRTRQWRKWGRCGPPCSDQHVFGSAPAGRCSGGRQCLAWSCLPLRIRSLLHRRRAERWGGQSILRPHAAGRRTGRPRWWGGRRVGQPDPALRGVDMGANGGGPRPRALGALHRRRWLYPADPASVVARRRARHRGRDRSAGDRGRPAAPALGRGHDRTGGLRCLRRCAAGRSVGHRPRRWQGLPERDGAPVRCRGDGCVLVGVGARPPCHHGDLRTAAPDRGRTGLRQPDRPAGRPPRTRHPCDPRKPISACPGGPWPAQRPWDRQRRDGCVTPTAGTAPSAARRLRGDPDNARPRVHRRSWLGGAPLTGRKRTPRRSRSGGDRPLPLRSVSRRAPRPQHCEAGPASARPPQHRERGFGPCQPAQPGKVVVPRKMCPIRHQRHKTPPVMPSPIARPVFCMRKRHGPVVLRLAFRALRTSAPADTAFR